MMRDETLHTYTITEEESFSVQARLSMRARTEDISGVGVKIFTVRLRLGLSFRHP